MAGKRPVEQKAMVGSADSRLARGALALVVFAAVGAALAAAQPVPPAAEPGLPPPVAAATPVPPAAVAAPAPPPAHAAAPAPAPAEAGEDAIVLSFEAADIREVVASLAGALGISYQIDPRVEGQVTIRTTGRIPRSELFPIFNQILRSHGIAAVKVGEIYNIMPIAEAKTRVNVSRKG